MGKTITDNELTTYLSQGVNNIVSDVIKATFQNPRETKFLTKYYLNSKKAENIRTNFEKQGQHIPTFLISSITHSCNLFCKGCYARENGICHENNDVPMLLADEWEDIFRQAVDVGISFNLLAGGEPLLRKDVILRAAGIEEMIFPIFTNGIMIDEAYVIFFNEHRNLVPVLSLEGTEKSTDSRRGEGTYRQLLHKMSMLKEKKILFGVSITVTTRNLTEVTNPQFIEMLVENGCKLVFFIEYVPINKAVEDFAFSDEERSRMEILQEGLRKQFESVIFLSFPGDEKSMGGCLAAGRGFFHINPYGAAEACPFSPYSDCSLKEHTLLEVLQSPFFKRLKEAELGNAEHRGGCALFEQKEIVKMIHG